MKNELEQRYDPSEWQWSEDGRAFSLDSLSRDDLLQVACSCMDALDRAEYLSRAQQQIFNGWRLGEEYE